jgi:hypothetical protein
MNSDQLYVFALIADNLENLPRIFRAAFTHPWVESYQIGFGPPLVRSTKALTERTKECASAIEKLSVYLEECIIDQDECKRLADLQRRLVVRRFGPVEAESLSEASRQALDLRIRLKSPLTASPEILASFESHKLALNEISESNRAALGAHFLIRLDDPRNVRYFDLPELGLAEHLDKTKTCALELRVPVACRDYWATYLKVLSDIAPFTMAEIGDPRSWAKVSRDGRSL